MGVLAVAGGVLLAVFVLVIIGIVIMVCNGWGFYT